ncbi:glutamyl-tRNA(Gln) amidotransferase subunit E [Williamwhitmania taraxaci]|uniref:Glutamyl-tRNA(Gln) amidotransferase subunit E n=2 Tax=Williamwhitmania taraxaci TaxID=1640674 RepID=A0A1G6RU79_9BACT|nr:glutamyl-tRNA(Gln) amidotransferase subunit E [Williamwhitmania taraxaci]
MKSAKIFTILPMETNNSKADQQISLDRYLQSMKEIGYISLAEATNEDYERIGFKSGLEVHQQLLTKRKLFCRCPAGIFHKHNDYTAEVVRHMRPTLSEMGVYDGTALMEFRTRKEIVYRLNNKTACTYETDDTPPFKIDMEALEIALEISLLCKLNIVGEVHITRKQYLDGSIPTGFQRTAIIGIEGEIQLRNKKVGILQLSIEEDSCREVSDIGHVRIYKTDRLGMPLIETVTHPQLFTPWELAEAGNHIRFMNRSTGLVRTGIGAARQDVNVSCRGGARVEIKGVAHIAWIPKLSHIEAFRQYALLHLRDELNSRIPDYKLWKIESKELDPVEFGFNFPTNLPYTVPLSLIGVKLPNFAGALSHFTQPGRCFGNEITERLKVIACLERPNMVHSEEIEKDAICFNFHKLGKILNATPKDAMLVFWGPEADVKTALETIEERCIMAFEGIPLETRKGLPDGTTIFERVLPGADRMYPDTDSAPVAIEQQHIDVVTKRLATDLHLRIAQLQGWNVPESCWTFLLRHNLVVLVEKIASIGYPPKAVAILIAEHFKHLVTKKLATIEEANRIFDMLKLMQKQRLDFGLADDLLTAIFQNPSATFDEALLLCGYNVYRFEELSAMILPLVEEFGQIRRTINSENAVRWVMGKLRKAAKGNLPLSSLLPLVLPVVNHNLKPHQFTL